MGQHGNNPVHQIDAGAPIQGFPIQCAALLYIVGHIRNVHAKTVMVSFSGQRNGIVQIFGIFSVNGHRLPVPDILPSCHICRTHRFCHVFCLFQNLFRKFHRQIISFYNRHNICSRIIDMPDNLHYFSFRFLPVTAITGEFHYHFMAVHRTLGMLQGNKYILGQFQIIRHHKTETFALLKSAHQTGDASLEYFFHHAFPAFS